MFYFHLLHRYYYQNLKEDAIKRAKENAERKRLKKAEFAAKRRVEARKKAAASALKRKLKLQREAEVAKMRIEDEESQLFESRTRTEIKITQQRSRRW
jgi:hypothetical protein